MSSLATLYADALNNIERGVKVDDLFTIATRKSGIKVVDNAYKILNNTLKIQIQTFATQEAEFHFDGKTQFAAISNIQKSHCADTLHTLQEYYNNGAWVQFFEDVSTNIVQEIYNTVDNLETMTYDEFPSMNEMVGISQFLFDFRAQGIQYHPDIYQGEMLSMTDHLTQQTLNICAQMLAVEKPNIPTHTIKLGRH